LENLNSELTSKPSDPEPSKPKTAKKNSRLRNMAPFIFISPFFLLFAIFTFYPIVYSLVLSFNQWSSGEMTFVGFQNFTRLLTDPIFWKSLSNTGIYLIIQVPLMLFLAAVLAIMVNSQALRFKAFFRLAFFLPAVIDLVTYSIVFSLIFHENNGLINQLLQWIGIGPINWVTDGFWAKVLIIIVITWRWVGYNMVIILAALQSIPNDLYESAKLDGAGIFATFRYITIPMLKPILLFCSILSTVGTLQLFAEPLILTRGGPNSETISVMLYIYNTAFSSFDFGLASAGAYIVTTIIAIFSYLQIRISKGGAI
jgi:lactose/L-arabinose transport system permease protein